MAKRDRRLERPFQRVAAGEFRAVRRQFAKLVHGKGSTIDKVVVGQDVREALDRRFPVVALETTILSHGMPYPQNLETGLAVERIVREHKAIPATIAVLNGQVRIGLSNDELAHFATSSTILKLSRADLPYAIARGLDGATTVAATMICAHLAGIQVFATGAIGGVHRGAERTLDISADLEELARTPVAVVCSGAKAFSKASLRTEDLSVRSIRSSSVPLFPRAFWISKLPRKIIRRLASAAAKW